jgi:hypothetical protein
MRGASRAQVPHLQPICTGTGTGKQGSTGNGGLAVETKKRRKQVPGPVCCGLCSAVAVPCRIDLDQRPRQAKRPPGLVALGTQLALES